MSESTPAEQQIYKCVHEVTGPIDEKLSQLSKDFIESHDGLQDGVLKLRQHLNGIEAMLENIEKAPSTPNRAELYAALAKAQGEMKPAEKNKTAEIRKKDDYNIILYTFKYADLASCLEAIRKPFADNELCLIQIPSLGEGNDIHMRTVIGHSSGQTVSCEMTMKAASDTPQAIGTVMAYLRRYSLCSITGVAQFDDDGSGGIKDESDYPRITTAEAEQIIIKADELCGARADQVIARMLKGVFGGITVVGDIKAGEAKVALVNLQNAADLIEKTAKAAKKKDRDDRKAAEDQG